MATINDNNKTLTIPTADRMQSNRNFYTSLMRIQSGSYISVWQFVIKYEAYTCHIIYQSYSYLLKKNENLYLHKNLYMNIDNRFICNCFKLETT